MKSRIGVAVTVSKIIGASLLVTLAAGCCLLPGDSAQAYIVVSHCPHVVYVDRGIKESAGTEEPGKWRPISAGERLLEYAFEGPGFVQLSKSGKGESWDEKVPLNDFRNKDAKGEYVVGINDACHFDPSLRD